MPVPVPPGVPVPVSVNDGAADLLPGTEGGAGAEDPRLKLNPPEAGTGVGAGADAGGPKENGEEEAGAGAGAAAGAEAPKENMVGDGVCFWVCIWVWVEEGAPNGGALPAPLPAPIVPIENVFEGAGAEEDGMPNEDVDAVPATGGEGIPVLPPARP